MANMSYCMWENTDRDLDQLIDDLDSSLEEGMSLKQFLDSKNEYERYAVMRVLDKCHMLIEFHKELEDKNA